MASNKIGGISGVNVGSIFVSAGFDVANFEKDSKKIINIVEKMPSEMSKASGAFAAIGSMAATAGMAIATGFAAAASAIVSTGVSTGVAYEQNAIAFQTMLGSAELGKQKLKELSDFAMKTPFSLPETVEGAKRLMAMGVSAEELIPTFDMLGNIASGVGVEKLPQLILAFGQVKTATKLTGMELRQFSEAGVPLLELLAKQAGKTTTQIKEDMENGIKPSFEDVKKALEMTTAEGGKFNGLMEKLAANTLGGRMQNLGDAFGKLARQVVGINELGEVAKGSFFDLLSKAADGLLKNLSWLVRNWNSVTKSMKPFIDEAQKVGIAISNYLGPKFDMLWQVIQKDLIPVLTDLWKRVLEPLMKVFGTIFVAAIGYVVDALRGLIPIVKALYEVLKPVIDVVVTLVTWIGNLASGILSVVGDIVGFIGSVFSATGQTDKHKEAVERLTKANDNLKLAQDRLNTSIVSLHQANLDLIYAQENEARATENATNMYNQFGENSPQYIKAQAELYVAHDQTTAAIKRQTDAKKENDDAISAVS